MTKKQVAQFLQESQRQVELMVKAGRLPKPFYISDSSPRWRRGDIERDASAHDLRRAFNARWSRKVNSMVLKELMRHASVTTTEKYYVGIQSDETSALLAGLMADTAAEGERKPNTAKKGE